MKTILPVGRLLPSDTASLCRLIASRHIPALSLAALGLAFAATPANAATITVYAGDVTANDPVHCSIVDAFNAANKNTATGACPAGDDATNGGDTIVLPKGSTFLLTNTLTITSTVTVQGNGAILDGGNAVEVLYNNNTATLNEITVTHGYASTFYGGGIDSYRGNLILNDSTVTSNTANYAGGGIESKGTNLILNNTTVSGNSATFGGGVYQFSGSLTLTNSTITGNSGSIGGGIEEFYIKQITQTNTIIARNSGGNCASYESSSSRGSNNLSDDGSCGPTFTASASLNLQPLADNGGPTQTIALGAASSAIDAGNDATCAADPIDNLDQRGYVRPVGAHCDVGALEYGASAPVAGVPLIAIGNHILFPGRNIGTFSAPRTVTVTNKGTANLVISNTLSIGGTNSTDFSLSNDTCNQATVAANASCTFQLGFSPSAAGARSASIEIDSNDPAHAIKTISLTGTGAPLAPTDVTGTPGQGQVTLNWTASDGADSYEVYETNAVKPIQTGINGTSDTITGLSAGKTYHFKIRAGSSGTYGRYSKAITVKLPPIPTVTISFNPASVVSGQSSTLTWSSADLSTATTCVASGDWSGTRLRKNSLTVTRGIVGTYTYFLDCSNSSGSDTESAVLTVTK